MLQREDMDDLSTPPQYARHEPPSQHRVASVPVHAESKTVIETASGEACVPATTLVPTQDLEQSTGVIHSSPSSSNTANSDPGRYG